MAPRSPRIYDAIQLYIGSDTIEQKHTNDGMLLEAGTEFGDSRVAVWTKAHQIVRPVHGRDIHLGVRKNQGSRCSACGLPRRNRPSRVEEAVDVKKTVGTSTMELSFLEEETARPAHEAEPSIERDERASYGERIQSLTEEEVRAWLQWAEETIEMEYEHTTNNLSLSQFL